MKNSSGKKILTIHGIFSEQIEQLHGTTTAKISKKYETYALACANAITVISKESLDYYSSLGYDVYQIPNAIDLDFLSSSKDRRYQKQVIFAGRLSSEKGIDSLIDIGKKLPSDIELIILGNGPEKQKIKELSKTIKNVHYLGYQTKEDTLSLIRGSDILIQPSLKEGISSTILESMASETVVIASNVGGNNELINNGVNGIIVDSEDVDSFVNKITFLLNNQKLRQSLENQGKITVKNYGWDTVGKQYLKLYESLLNQSK